MTIRQDRYVVADTNKIKKVDIIEVPQVPDDPILRRSDVQQQVNNSTLPASSRAVNLAIESINSNLDLKADRVELEGLATENYVNEKIDEKEIGITEPELISKSVGSGKWMREGSAKQDFLKDVGFYNILGGLLRGSSGVSLGGYFDELQVGFNFSKLGMDRSFLYYEVQGMYTDSQDDMIMFYELRGSRIFRAVRRNASAVWGSFTEILSNVNTFPDSNGVLHNTKTPIDTLNTSDMADTVVDNDLLTVTSGAVYRAIKQLTDQITSLEARVRELEDGGV